METRCDDVALAGFTLAVILLPPPFQCQTDSSSNLLGYCLGLFEVSLLEMQFWLELNFPSVELPGGQALAARAATAATSYSHDPEISA